MAHIHSSWPASSTDELLSVHLDRTVMDAPAALRITVTVAPRDANRSFRIETESSTYYRSSQIPLNGGRAARKHTIVYLQDNPDGPR